MEAVAAGIGIAGFAFQCFQGCVAGFAFFNTAQSIGIDGDMFRAGLEMEKYRFLTWGKRAGITHDGVNENTNMNWQLAIMFLEQLQALLTSADLLKKRYALDVTQDIVKDSDRLAVSEAPKEGLARLVQKLRPDVYTTTSRIIQAQNGPMKRLRWAAMDKDKATRVIGDIANINSRLEFLLDSAERERQNTENARFVRSLISLASSTTEVVEIRHLLGNEMTPNLGRNAIRAAASVKQIRLCIGADRREDEVQPTQKETRSTIPPLKNLKRTIRPFAGKALTYTGLEFASYGKQQVLVQWKVAEDEQWSKYVDQMKSLAVLLTSLSDQSFRCLPCLGYYSAESRGRHGLIFSLPAEGPGPWKMTTLSDIIGLQVRVPLNRRLQLARALAETVLQLHTAGWLHKNLRPENVMFLGPPGASAEDLLRTEPFVMGYDSARPDDPDAAAALTQVPEHDLVADLYRHPQARGLGRETFQKRFDVYALGCLLVEVMCWEPLMGMHHRFTRPGLARAIEDAVRGNTVVEIPTVLDLFDNSDARDSVAHHVGEHMVAIITKCTNMAKSEDGQDASLDVQHATLERLSWWRV
ncbi:Prion-inhibition and propagation [Microdochium nivale]|nr:Prion-inhibition and propagation [Microdochium nivale]